MPRWQWNMHLRLCFICFLTLVPMCAYTLTLFYVRPTEAWGAAAVRWLDNFDDSVNAILLFAFSGMVRRAALNKRPDHPQRVVSRTTKSNVSMLSQTV